jgi:heat shock protein HspQ
MREAKFLIGQTIIHVKQHYRGIIVDVDENFVTSQGRPLLRLGAGQSVNEPWYRVLVDDSDIVSYVRESMLIDDPTKAPIDNPKLEEFLEQNEHGDYNPTGRLN